MKASEHASVRACSQPGLQNFASAIGGHSPRARPRIPSASHSRGMREPPGRPLAVPTGEAAPRACRNIPAAYMLSAVREKLDRGFAEPWRSTGAARYFQLGSAAVGVGPVGVSGWLSGAAKGNAA